ncbi:hypothetical protein ABZ397_21745 [Streptomyces sp. NPDC005876]|uniref:hypothetical protein n=1 Tax=Streptomyces sp. NPDC005876 TaxID=3157076 RepID=UPI0033C862DF
MRLYRRLASATVAVLFVFAVPYEALSSSPVREDPRADPFGAACRVRTTGSRVTAYCHNPYPDPDHLRLHVECLRWWDLDGDSAPVTAGPARTVRLTGRCWQEVGAAWVSHARTAPR